MIPEWTPSQDWKPGRFRVRRPIDPMRIPDFMLKSSAFVVSIASEGSEDEYDLESSGFLVGLPSTVGHGNSFFYFVTAAHVTDRIKSRSGIRVNLKRGGTEVIPVAEWFKHPTDPNADVAVAVFRNKYEDYDVEFMGEAVFRSREDLLRHDMGIGDEVWFPGLFTLTQQESDQRNHPILRMGNLAMMPDKPVPTELGYMDAYLVEARSIGGISGAPVFCRRTVSLLWNDSVARAGESMRAIHGITGEVHLIGMMHGHWDVDESQINQARLEQKDGGVNMGVAIVVPMDKILETINQPALVERRADEEEKFRRRNAATMD